MAKTRAEVITSALRRIGVVAEDEAASTAMETNAGEVLDTLFAEIEVSKDVTWDLTTVPDEAFIALSNLLAADVAPLYPPAQAPYPRGVAWMRLMGIIRPDDREDYRDTDDDGTVSDAEADAGERARFY